MVIHNKLYEHIECITAREFINNLRASDERWLPGDATQTPWIFRGQGDVRWDLTATVWRNFDSIRNFLDDKTFEYLINKYMQKPVRLGMASIVHNPNDTLKLANDNPNIKDVIATAIYEVELVRQFAEFVDNLGHPIPRDPVLRWGGHNLFDLDKIIQMAFHNFTANQTFINPVWTNKSHPITALARHHGVPSSLIDFTNNPLIAAFFAADKADMKTEIAVWAINSNIINMSSRLQMVNVFRSELGYLHAQDGVLIYDAKSDDYYLRNGEWPSLSNIFDEFDPEYSSHEIFKCVTVPSSEALEVLRLLRAEKIAKPYLMPSFDYITETIVKQFEYPSF